MEGVRRAAAHCFSTAGSQFFAGAVGPRVALPSGRATLRVAGWLAPIHATEQAHRWGAVPGCAPHRRHLVSSTESRWEERWARTAIVGTLSIRCAMILRSSSWSNQSEGRPPPRHEIHPRAGLVGGPRRYGGSILQPVC